MGDRQGDDARGAAAGGRFDAVLLDLDGVMTRTARVHARAWKRTFDEFMADRADPDGPAGERLDPFDERADYLQYVDGVPRYDGVRSFLRSRGIRVPEGSPDDDPAAETVSGLGNRKDLLFLDLLGRDGIGVYDDAVAKVREWRAAGLRTAIVSSSRSCREVLEAAGLVDLFDVRVDGVVGEGMGLAGKPAPDYFSEAARRLGVKPERAVVVEDAESGVRAGRAGGFGLVVGIDRIGRKDDLKRMGADLVVSSLLDLQLPGQGS